MAPINQLGYGHAGFNIFKSLQKKCDVALHLIGQPQVVSQQDAATIRSGLELATKFDPKAPCIKVWHQNQMAERIGSGKFIGFPIFELDTFTDAEKHHLSCCDEIMVCSHWAKDVIIDNIGEKPVHVVPLGVDSEVFKPSPMASANKTIFFTCGKWEVRKGHDILIKAWDRLTQINPDVELWMMTENPFNTPEEEEKWKKLYRRPNIKFIPRVQTHLDVYNIMKDSHCGIFLSRAEGWNLEALEMMAAGKPIIITNYSAHTEFCNKENSLLIDIDSKEPAHDGKWFFGQGNWASIQQEQINKAVEYMLKICDHRKSEEEQICKIVDNSIKTAQKFSWDFSAERILNHV